MINAEKAYPTLFVSEIRCFDYSGAPSEGEFQVKWKINPHMLVGQIDLKNAFCSHKNFLRKLEAAGAKLVRLSFLPELYDSVFIKDPFLIREKNQELTVLIASFKHEERRAEVERRVAQLIELGVKLFEKCPFVFEGGDTHVLSNGSLALFGFGQRSEPDAALYVERFLEIPVLSLELVDPFLYHLDTALNVVNNNIVLACKRAFSEDSWFRLCQDSRFAQVIEVSYEAACAFALNFVEVDNQIFVSTPSEEVNSILQSLGKSVVNLELLDFKRAGGSAACLVSRIHG